MLARQGIDAASASDLVRDAICPRPAVQERSRVTLEKILDAAEAVLAESGLDAATVPRIAERAGVSVGAVYRRFPDKDAVLRAVYGRFFARAMSQQCARMAQLERLPNGLAELTRILIGSLVMSYRLQRGILRALVHYARTHHDPEFRRQADQMNAHNLRFAEELLLPHAAEITHPDPPTAVRTGLYFVGYVLRETVLAGDDAPRLPIPEEQLAEELTRLYLGYLGVAGPASPPGAWARWIEGGALAVPVGRRAR